MQFAPVSRSLYDEALSHSSHSGDEKVGNSLIALIESRMIREEGLGPSQVRIEKIESKAVDSSHDDFLTLQ